jgi:hypothetical protein
MQEHWPRIFEDRYGAGAYQRLMSLFDRPCLTFAEIATKFGVTRERARQWHVQLLPDAPRGHDRQRLCVVQRKKKQLLEDPLFRAFYQHARPHVAAGRITLIRTREGFRRRIVRLDTWTVAIKHARRHPAPDGDSRKAAYILTNSQRRVDYIYYWLASDDYLLVPKNALPADRTTFLDTPTSKYQRFRNTFSAMFQLSAQRNRHPDKSLRWNWRVTDERLT